MEKWTSNIDCGKVLAIVGAVNKGGEKRITSSAWSSSSSFEIYKHKANLGVAVQGDYENMGIGRAMIKFLLEIAKKRGMRKVCSLVGTSKERTIQVYKSSGFMIKGRLRRESYVDRKFDDELGMTLFPE